MKFFLVAACLAVAVAAESSTDSLLWENFKFTHKKSYSKIEEVQRYNVFKQNLRKIEEHNQKYEAGEKTYTLGVNQFADMSSEEFSKFLGTQRVSNRNSSVPRTRFVKVEGASVPKSIDWREKNAVTPIKNQGYCGGCWAFATSGALEGAYAIKHKKLVSFSEQQLIDCATDDYNMAGCDGGQLDPAFDYMKDFGMETEADYPFEGEDGVCNYAKSKVVAGSKVTGYVDIDELDEEALVHAVGTAGPVAVAINGDGIQLYSHGIFDQAECKSEGVDHGVLAVGYGTENGVDYWIVKNSWGTTYGEQGYIRMRRGVNTCDIALQPSYPTV